MLLTLFEAIYKSFITFIGLIPDFLKLYNVVDDLKTHFLSVAFDVPNWVIGLVGFIIFLIFIFRKKIINK